MNASPVRAAVAEGLGTAFLLACVVGSGIMGERLFGGNAGLALLSNSLATGAALVALIIAGGPVSGSHFNPVVTLGEAAAGRFAWSRVPAYLGAQIVGAFAGVAAAHGMFGLPLFTASSHIRAGAPQWLGEAVATFGLCLVILASRKRPMAPFAIGAYVTAAYWFTSSTAFANPAVTLARAATDSFAGIRPADAPAFIAMQALGAALAFLCFRAPANHPS